MALQRVPVREGGVTDMTDSPTSPALHAALAILVSVSEAEFSVGFKLLTVGRGSLP